MKRKTLLTIPFLLIAGLASAGLQGATHSIVLPSIPTALKAGDGKEKVETFCAICHSLDYIAMQPKLSMAQWTATVNKMVKVMGAPINEDDARKIIAYLAVQYGKGEGRR